MNRKKVVMILAGLPALLPGQPAPAQLPPGARTIQLELEGVQMTPRINNHRQVAFRWTHPDPLVYDIYLWSIGDGTLEKLTSSDCFCVSPSLNDHGMIVWSHHPPEFNKYGNLTFYSCGASWILSGSVTSDEFPSINEVGHVLWQAWMELVEGKAKETMFYDGINIYQKTYGGNIFLSEPPYAFLGQYGGNLTIDWTFGLFDGFTTAILHDNKGTWEVVGVPEPLAVPWVNSSGVFVVQARTPIPSGSIYKGDVHSDELREFRFTSHVNGHNNRGDILLSTTLEGGLNGSVWLYRNGVFYQPFPGLTQVTNLYINDRGDIVGRGGASLPEDIFVTLIDPIPGDHDEDGDVDAYDVAGFAACATGPVGAEAPPPALHYTCGMMDFDGDADVDLADAAGFFNTVTGECALGITTPPDGNEVCTGGSLSLSMAARGPVESIQWRFKGEDIPGAVGSTYTIPNATTAHAGEYGVRLTSACGWEITSDDRHRVKVRTAKPVINQHPQSQTVCPGSDVRLRTTLVPGGDPQFGDFVHTKWYKNGQLIEDAADWWVYLLREVTTADAGTYHCVVSNACGSTTSQAATLTIAPPTGLPQIIGHPAPTYPTKGQYAKVWVKAWCADSYLWLKNGVPIPGATGPALEFAAVTCDDSGEYRVRITNTHGAVLSDPGKMTVTNCP